MKPTDEIQPEIQPEPQDVHDNNTPRTKEEWFKSKWKTNKYTDNINSTVFCFMKYLVMKI